MFVELGSTEKEEIRVEIQFRRDARKFTALLVSKKSQRSDVVKNFTFLALIGFINDVYGYCCK